MLIEAAIGDAYGGQFEWGCDPQEIAQHNDLTYKMVQPGLIKPGCYTDDTQMMIALAEALIEDDPWTRESIADRFVKCFQRDPRRGYTGVFYQILINTHSGRELLSKIHGNSERSGAAMRAAPLGFIKDISELKKKCAIQASVTHDSPAGKSSALFVALATHYFRYVDNNIEKLYEWITNQVQDDDVALVHFASSYEDWPQEKQVSTLGWHCVRAARTAVFYNGDLSGLLKQSVSYGGDTDTVACIAMAMASQRIGVKNNLPQNLYDGLENGPYGRDYLIQLDKRLEGKYAR